MYANSSFCENYKFIKTYYHFQNECKIPIV